jgi:hypothetical protein
VLVAEGHDPLLGPGALLVAAGAAERRVEAVLGDRVQEGHGLEPVARGSRAGLLDHAAAVDRRLDRGDDELDPELGHAAIAEVDDLGKVVPGVDVHDRERDRGRPERLVGQVQEDDRVLPAAEEQDGPLALGGDLPHDEDGLRLERAKVGELEVHDVGEASRC